MTDSNEKHNTRDAQCASPTGFMTLRGRLVGADGDPPGFCPRAADLLIEVSA